MAKLIITTSEKYETNILLELDNGDQVEVDTTAYELLKAILGGEAQAVVQAQQVQPSSSSHATLLMTM